MSTQPPFSTQQNPALQGTLVTPAGPIHFETLARLIERVGVLLLLGGVLHYVLNGQTALVASRLESIDRQLATMNQSFASYLTEQTRQRDAERNRQP